MKFGTMIRELQNPGLLYLAAILHDTGKGRASDDHAAESGRLARGVLDRLEMDAYDAAIVIKLIESHLEMSSALRRDIFDVEAVRTFAAKMQTHELLRMLTLLTYADIHAVHPDALTPWKAENLWRLSMRTANQLDRVVDEERVHAPGKGGRASWKGSAEKVATVLSQAGDKAQCCGAVPGRDFRSGICRRAARATSVRHFEMTEKFG